MYSSSKIPDLGWRLRVLRMRRMMPLTELAQRSQLGIAYLSRLERDTLTNIRPKPSTIGRYLHALGATWEECEAIYHREREPLTIGEIEQQVRETAWIVENDSDPIELSDERWYTWYYNHAARSVLGLTPKEYKLAIGRHLLHATIDPTHPLYSRVPDEDREALFALHAATFKTVFASQEFDKWYQQVVRCIYAFPWAAHIWESPPTNPVPLVLGNFDFTVLSPSMGPLAFRCQSDALALNPRFLIRTWAHKDNSTAIRIAVLRNHPDSVYSYKEGLPKGFKRKDYATGMARSSVHGLNCGPCL